MSDHKLAEAQAAIHTARLVAEKHRGAAMLEIEHYLSRAASALAAHEAEQQIGGAVARLLHWHGPAHYPVPHGGIAARTFAEYPKEEANKPDSYWKNGELLYTRPQHILSDEQIADIAELEFKAGKLTWYGLEKDSNDVFSRPVVSQSVCDLVRACMRNVTKDTK